MKDYLAKVISQKEERMNEIKKQVEASTDLNEVRSLSKQLEILKEEATEARNQLSILEKGSDDNTDVESRGNVPANANLLGTYEPQKEERKNPYATMEYREAFANWVKTGNWEYRGATEGMVITTDIGKVVPQTVMDEFIKELKVYGQLYNAVRKINVKGEVEFPIEELKPTVSWISETQPSNGQAVPELKTSVSFGYHMCEARISQSLLSSIVSIDALEKEIASLLTEAFLREFDRVIIKGTGSGQPLGVVNDERVPENHKIVMTETQMGNWAYWRTELFSKIGLAYRGKGILLMTPATWESQILTLKDSNHRPLYEETYDAVSGQTKCRFNGRDVVLVENDILADFTTANTGDVFAVYMNASDYCINSNMQIGFDRYLDKDKNKWINKGLCVMDGKLLDVYGCFIISKGATENNPAEPQG